MRKFIFILLFLFVFFWGTGEVEAHRSGCHRWHSCPSDRGTYTCGDLGHPCRYPTYPEGSAPYVPPATPKPIITSIPKPTPIPTPTSTETPTLTPEVKGETTQSPTPIAAVEGTQVQETTTGDTLLGLGILAVIAGGVFWLLRILWRELREWSTS